MGGGVQLLSSTDSTYCPSKASLYDDYRMSWRTTDNKLVNFNSFFDIDLANYRYINWNPIPAMIRGYHNNRNKILSRQYLYQKVPQGLLLHTKYENSQKVFSQIILNRNTVAGTLRVSSVSDYTNISISSGRGYFGGSQSYEGTYTSTLGTIQGIFIVLKKITLTNGNQQANKNIIQIRSNLSSTTDGYLNSGIQIGFQPNNSMYFRENMNAPWRSYYPSEVPEIQTTSGATGYASCAFYYTGFGLAAMFYDFYNGGTPKTVLYNGYTTNQSDIVGKNGTTYTIILGGKQYDNMCFQGYIEEIQIGFVTSYT